MDLVLRWVHVLAIVTWLGGMLFIALVLVPVTHRVPDPRLRSDLVSETGKRFRTVAWIGLAFLIGSGVIMLLRRPWLLRAPAFQVKAALVAVALGLAVVHDFVIGPRAGRLPPEAAGALRRRVTWLARGNLLLVLVIVALGLYLRG